MKNLKFNGMEFAGALGDLGTLIPIFILIVAINGLNPSIILLLVGLLYIFCGFYYNIPMPVQPMKAMAAIAIASGLGASVIQAGAVLMGIILLFLSLTGCVDLLSRIFSKPIIRGIQLGVGLMLIRTSFSLITKRINVESQICWLDIGIPLNLIIIFIGIIIMLIFLWNNRFPASTSILSFGIMVSIIDGKANSLMLPSFPIQEFNLVIPSLSDFMTAFFLLVITQLPLTLGNAIVATKDVAKRYFPDKADKVNARSLSIGMGITNIFAGLFSGMPVCHGSGGLTAHYSFGARSGGCCIIIGLICLCLSLIFGSGVSGVFKIIPYPLLGIMLFYVGIKHSLLITDLDKNGLLIALAMGLTAIFTRNLLVSYLFGMSLSFLIKTCFKVSLKSSKCDNSSLSL